MDITIINKGMKFDLPYDGSSYAPAAVIHVVDVGNIQLPVSLKVIKTFLYNCTAVINGWNLS